MGAGVRAAGPSCNSYRGGGCWVLLLTQPVSAAGAVAGGVAELAIPTPTPMALHCVRPKGVPLPHGPHRHAAAESRGS
jgi:hypothetical protein